MFKTNPDSSRSRHQDGSKCARTFLEKISVNNKRRECWRKWSNCQTLMLVGPMKKEKRIG